MSPSPSSSSNKKDNKPPLFCLVDTESTVLQKQTEKECHPYFVDLSKLPDDQKNHLKRIGLLADGGRDGAHDVRLLREKHQRYLEGVWKRPLKAHFVSLDSSRPWMLYWCLHGYDLLSSNNGGGFEEKITSSEGTSMVATLEDCWQGYHTPDAEIPAIVARDDDPLYFQLHEDDEHREGGARTSTEKARYYCGGFGGGPGQMAHAATTYAAVLSLCLLATSGPSRDSSMDQSGGSNGHNPGNGHNDDDYDSLHYSDRARRVLSEIRIPLYRWMASLQVPSTGGYRMQHDGEVDVRATYTIACCSKLLGLLEKPPAPNGTDPSTGFTVLGRPAVIGFVKSCQTYEGGMGGEPYAEAHGGYTFCAVAALQLLGALNDDDNGSDGQRFDVAALLGWLGRRQLSYEGGFSGRSNKLVDGCYSFWQGGAVSIASSCADRLAGSDRNDDDEDPWLSRHRKQQQQQNLRKPGDDYGASNTGPDLPFPLLYDVFLLERYILLCAQEITGGLRDKPSKPRDFYHTCYNLSGLSIAQHYSWGTDGGGGIDDGESSNSKDAGFGDPQQTLVGQTHPCYNIRIDRVSVILDIDWAE